MFKPSPKGKKTKSLHYGRRMSLSFTTPLDSFLFYEQDARKVPMRDNTGAVTGYQQVFGIPSKQRQPYSPKKRADVAHTRRLGACDRCRSYKMKVFIPAVHHSHFALATL